MMQQIIFCIQPKILDSLTKSFFPCAHIAAQIAGNLRKSTVIKFDKQKLQLFKALHWEKNV